MKRISLLLCALLTTLLAGAQSQTLQLKGQTVDSAGNPVGYATLMLTPFGEEYNPSAPNHQGTAADSEGYFSFATPEGHYTLTINCLGYKELVREVVLDASTDLGAIALEEDAQLIESVAITGELIKREADRFVMNNIAESTIAKGRDSYELLKLAPSVYADESGSISINGKAGAKILINEREVRMTGEQLMSYLKAIPAENLQKIEIIPESGADYDADSASGIIKITIRKQRESGLSGSVALGGHFSTQVPNYTIGPNGNLNYKSGKWNLYGNLSLSTYTYNSGDLVMRESTQYDNGASLTSTTAMENAGSSGGGMVGAIYDLDEKSSLGVEYNLWYVPTKPTTNYSTLDYTLGDYSEAHTSIYEQTRTSTNHSLTANYIRTLDERGSTFKLIADWAGNISQGVNNNADRSVVTIGGVAGAPRDSLYRNRSTADYAYYTLTAAVEKKLSELTTISYGAKYTLTDTYSRTDYDYKRGEEWQGLEAYNHLTDYNEHIAALYGIYSTRFLSGASLSAGLRAEYTSIPQLSERYVSLFPHLNASMPLNPTQTVILSAAYKRAISRPSFWTMNPVRTQLSEFSYQVGNPDLKPVYANNFSLTGIFFYRYSLTLGASLQDNIIQQLSMVDDADPTGRTLKYLHVNLHNVYQYYAQLSIPAQVTPWWSINANLLGVMIDQKIVSNQANDRTFTAQGYMANSFTLPKGWSIDLSGHFMTDAHIGNLTQKGTGNISLAVKKQLLGDKLTLNIGLNNILPTSNQDVFSEGEGFSRTLYSPNLWMRSINIGIRYNFQSGKMFRARSVESGASDEKSRMGN